MSRLKKFKNKDSRNKFKSISCALVLMISTGIVGNVGTYAVFTDRDNISSDISLSTGDVDIEISNGFTKLDVKSGFIFEETITISNNGTLNQNIGLALSSSLDWIDFKIDFIDEKYEDIEHLSTTERYIQDISSGKLAILSPNNTIQAKVVVTIGTVPNDIANESMNFNITACATQINNENSITKNRFYDRAIQINTIQFREENNIITSENNLITSESGQIKVEGLRQDNNFLEISYMSEFSKPKSIEIIPNSGTGLFKDAKVSMQSNNTFHIDNVNAYEYPNYKFDDDYGKDTVIIRFTYDNGLTKDIHFDFKSVYNVHGNRVAVAKYTDVTKEMNELEKEEIESSEPESIEPPKEETTQPNEPESIEPPKEEITQPSEPDSIEPPKEEITQPSEPDSIEPPKEEITQPSEPDSIEPPTEETTHIQPDISLPQKEENDG